MENKINGTAGLQSLQSGVMTSLPLNRLPLDNTITDWDITNALQEKTATLQNSKQSTLPSNQSIANSFKEPDELKEVTGESLLKNKVQEIPCLLTPLLQTVGLACVAGGSDLGKSALLRQFAIAVATGQDSFLGFPLHPNHKSAIFVSTEDDKNATAFLLSKQAKIFLPEQLKSLRFVFNTDNLLEGVHNSLTRQPADLVAIDCFADAFGGDLKDTQKVRAHLHPFQQLAVKHQCLVLFLHHTAKRTENFEPSKNNLLSGQGFETKMRMVMELRPDLANPLHRHLCIVKGNYLPAKYKKESFVLQFHEDSFTFYNTGERTLFELLAKGQEDGSKAKYELAKSLKESGHTYEQIAEALSFSSKGTVSKLFDKGEKFGW